MALHIMSTDKPYTHRIERHCETKHIPPGMALHDTKCFCRVLGTSFEPRSHTVGRERLTNYWRFSLFTTTDIQSSHPS